MSSPTTTLNSISTPTYSDAYGTTTSTSNPDTQSSGLVNYYFVFIALFLVVCFLGAWVVLKKRAQARHTRLHQTRSALSRDLEASNLGRGWTYGDSRRQRTDGSGWTALARRGRRGVDEGLDEQGEAPPPYKPSGDEGEGEGGVGNADVIAVPLRTLAREEVGRKPPEYSEAVAREVREDGDAGAEGRRSGGSSRGEGR